MLDKHEELLAAVQDAEKKARKIYEDGCTGIEPTFRKLRELGTQIKARVAQYKAAAPKQKSEGKAAEDSRTPKPAAQ